MKKILVSLVAIGAALFATSCVNELEEGINGKAGQVTFTVDAPELATRAYGDGAFAKHLMYAVYDVTAGGTVVENGVSLLTVGNVTEINAEGKATVQLELLDGNSYSLLFWAVSADYDKAFTIKWADKTMQMKETIEANNEAYDAFYAYVEPFTVDGVVTKSVTLYRPFAQLNYGSNDFNEAKNLFFEPEKSQVVIKNVPNVLNCVNGEVSGTTTITYESANVPTDSFTVAGNNYLAMNYVLVGEKKLFDTTLKVTAKNGKVIENDYATVPLQRNYRTNVYGSLLTNSSDFGIELKPGFTDPAHPYNPDAIVVVAPDGTTTSVDSFAKALSEAYSGDIIQLPAGEYTLPANISIKDGTRAAAKAITICGVGKDVVLKGAVGGNNNPGNYAQDLDITFENLTYKTANSGYSGGFGHAAKVTFNNCDIIGQMYCHSSAPHFFNNCTIDPLNGYLYTYASDVEFKGCTFNASEGKALQVYEDASTGENNVLIENCTFKAAKVAMTAATPAQPVTAIDINNNGAKFNVVVNNCTAEGFGTGKTSGSMLWNIKGGHKNINLTIDGEVVWTAGAEFVAIGVTKVEGVYHINSLAGLKWLATTVNDGNNFSGKTVVLDADINLASEEWTPIGNETNAFKGNFDGQNHTIKNLVVTGDNNYVGLFGYSFGGNTIKNLIVENANVTGDGFLGAVVGLAETTSFNNVTIKGDVYVEGTGQDIGALTGYTYGTLTDITVNANEGSYVKGESFFGGVVGYRGEGDITYTRVKSNIDVIGKYYMIGGITGFAQYGNKFVDCECSGNVSLTDGDPNSTNRWMRIGGIAGSWMDGDDSYVVTLENCSFTGKLSSKNTNGDYVKEFDNNGYVGRSYNTSNKGKLIIDGQWITSAADAAELNTKVSEGNAVISLPAGEYTFPKAFGENVTIVCEEGTVFTGNSKLNINGATVVGATFSNPTGNAVSGTINGTLKNCTFDGSNGLRGCYAGETVVFENCVFSGDVYGAHFDGGANDVVFRNCTFSGFNAMGSAITKLTLEGCTFKAGRSGYNGINMWGDTEMKECEFTFNSNGEKTEWVDAVGNDKTYKFVGCTVNGVPITAEQIGDYGSGNTIIVE